MTESVERPTRHECKKIKQEDKINLKYWPNIAGDVEFVKNLFHTAEQLYSKNYNIVQDIQIGVFDPVN